jgi:hypothetical protein
LSWSVVYSVKYRCRAQAPSGAAAALPILFLPLAYDGNIRSPRFAADDGPTASSRVLVLVYDVASNMCRTLNGGGYDSVDDGDPRGGAPPRTRQPRYGVGGGGSGGRVGFSLNPLSLHLPSIVPTRSRPGLYGL